jgi:hypothetical protein
MVLPLTDASGTHVAREGNGRNMNHEFSDTQGGDWPPWNDLARNKSDDVVLKDQRRSPRMV